jgi:hypothetical protein
LRSLAGERPPEAITTFLTFLTMSLLEVLSTNPSPRIILDNTTYHPHQILHVFTLLSCWTPHHLTLQHNVVFSFIMVECVNA